jgi:hypothetical protein
LPCCTCSSRRSPCAPSSAGTARGTRCASPSRRGAAVETLASVAGNYPQAAYARFTFSL